MSNKTVLFDLDGTLADSVPLIAKHVAETLTEFGAPTEASQIVPFIGRPLELTLSVFSSLPQDDPRIVELVDAYHASWFPIVEAHGPELLLPGAVGMLARLREAGYRIGIVTAKGSPEAHHMIDALGITDLVDAVVGDDMVDNGKPAPDPALLGLELLGATAAETWYVGDATTDLEMALAAGMRPMGITTGASTHDVLLEAGAEVVVEDVPQVADVVLA